jgi:hypothetical protein
MNSEATNESEGIAIGMFSNSKDGSISIGSWTNAQNMGTALGAGATTGQGQQAIAIGDGTSADGSFSIALGTRAEAQNHNEGVLGDANVTHSWIVTSDFTLNGIKYFEIPHQKPKK